VVGPSTLLWVKYVDKFIQTGISAEAVVTNELIKEAMTVRKLLKNRPEDPLLLRNLKEAAAKLAIAKEKENEEVDVNAPPPPLTNPIINASEMMALSDKELQRWKNYFYDFDKEKSGFVSMIYFFKSIDEPFTEFGKDLFLSLDALDPETDGIEFGDFIKAISTYCLFGPEEILRSLFLFSDKDCVSFITTEQFSAMLSDIYARARGVTNAILLDLSLPKGQLMGYDTFAKIHSNYPTLLYPVFRLQNKMRETFMGVDWWIAKLGKYEAVRMKIANSERPSASKMDLEMSRWEEDEARTARMAVRAREINKGGSALKIAFLKAKQLADELL
jgi:Ca2+-binding EF-hand superfamily protein